MELAPYRATILVIPLLFGSACSMSKYPERPLLLTPVNDVAHATGTIRGKSTPLGLQSGFVILETPGGEEFSGTYALLDTPEKESWQVILNSDAGMQMLCNYGVDEDRKHGSGECKTTGGAEYSLSF